MTALTNGATRMEAIGDFLLRRLSEAGLRHVFGVAGDFNLELLEQMQARSDLAWIGCCNELNAAYAADGHARTHGLAALVTTYGVGELSALCGVAGAYAEHVPVVAISGAPPLGDMERHALMHHSAADGDFSTMMACGRHFSVAQARLTSRNAVTEIDRCLRACVLEKRPAYLQLPSDLAYVVIETPSSPFCVTFDSAPELLDGFVRAALDRIARSGHGAILVDADVGRYGQGAAVQRLAERLGWPIAVMGSAKSVIAETHPLFAGIYSGRLSSPSVRRLVEAADCLLMLSVRFVDSTTGSFSQSIDPASCIAIDAWEGRIGGQAFPAIFMGDVLALLAEMPARSPVPAVPKLAPAPAERRLDQAWFWQRIAAFLAPGDVVVAENGTSLTGLTGVALPDGATMLSQTIWGAIGYTLPATLGSLLAAPSRRHLLFIGDGSFQMTAQELSTILRHRLSPLIFLINNDGYTIERLILGETSSYNDIQPWRYAALGEVFAAGAPFEARRVTTADELDRALEALAPRQVCRFIEVVTPRNDAPQALRDLGPIFARQDYGRAWANTTNREGTPP